MNVSATVNVLRLLANPSLCLPHHTIATFDQLPVPLSTAFTSRFGEKKPDIRAVVLDKDNCFSVPKKNEVHAPYQSKFDELRKAYPGSRLLIVSNSSGTGSDKGHVEADLLERNTGVKVLRHSTKKPGCHAEIMDYFRNAPDTGVTHESQIAIVGDRLFTDVLMANMMGSYGLWIQKGVVEDHGLLTRVERRVSTFLLRRGYSPPQPRSDFETPKMCYILHPACDNCKAPDLKRARLFAECDHYRTNDTRNLGELHEQYRARGLPAPDETWSKAGDRSWVHFEDYRWMLWPPRLCARWSPIASIELCLDCAGLFKVVNARLLSSDAIGLTIEAPDPTDIELFGDAAHAGLRTDKSAEPSQDVKVKREPR
ncbi:unnamed protein product [Zymoseptoria tritici ST99CH_1A5]|nr:unnamed protein product [Zymoseptoria tritici ST99CH_3D1]SMY21720.1 unnamed protein product [Zymoseptoria tritici ST99CH_1A5]